MKLLNKYGEMFAELSEKIHLDIESKTDEELKILELEARSVTDTNCAWSDYRIAKTVLEYVFYEQKNRNLNNQ